MTQVHRMPLRRAPLAGAVILLLPRLLSAATITVNDPGEASVPGKCTVVDAVAALNTALPMNSCAAGNGSNDTIDFSFFAGPTTISFGVLPANGVSALALTKPARLSAPLDVSGNPMVTLSRSTVSGTPAFRLISTTADLSIDGLTITGGSSPDNGGGVFADLYANLTIANSVVSNNYAATSGGGVTIDCGNLTVVHSRISGNSANKSGGGIYGADDQYHSGTTTCAGGHVTLDHSTLSGNTAITGGGGGAYLFKGYLSATRSTIDSNTAMGEGGGFAVFGTSMLVLSTLSGNVSQSYGGGASVQFTFKTFGSSIINNSGGHGGGVHAKYTGGNNSTFTGNIAGSGGAIEGSNVFLDFSTITANTAGTGAGINLSGGIPTSNSQFISTIIRGNLIGEDLHGNSAVSAILGNNSIIGSHSLPVPADTLDCDAKLGPLADNGGPTLTIALGAGSCAIDAGPATPGVTFDQRGPPFSRKFGVASDIGAFEVQNISDRIFYDGFEG